LTYQKKKTARKLEKKLKEIQKGEFLLCVGAAAFLLCVGVGHFKERVLYFIF
jgi:hypothetical protein